MGKTKNNIIQINGKRYDAGTGRPIDGLSGGKITPVKPAVEPSQQPSGGHAQSIHVQHVSESQPAKHTEHQAPRHSAQAARRHAPEHSKTLLRQAVKKPEPGLKRRTKAHGSTDHIVKQPAAHVEPKRSARHIDSQKLDRAKQIPKSGAVKKFSRSQPASISVPVTVKRIAPPRTHQANHVPHHTPPAKPKAPADDLLEQAIRHATSHEQRPPKHIAKRRRGLSRRVTSLAAMGVAFIVLGGFLAYSNLSSVQLKVASAKAGFNASLPGEAPAGYHLSHLNYSPGVVALNYHSNSDARSFAITEKASAWDSGTLRDSYLASSGQDYQTVESGGRTLYLLGENAATWVSGGVWYQVHSNGALSSRQLVTLASSL